MLPRYIFVTLRLCVADNTAHACRFDFRHAATPLLRHATPAMLRLSLPPRHARQHAAMSERRGRASVMRRRRSVRKDSAKGGAEAVERQRC